MLEGNGYHVELFQSAIEAITRSPVGAAARDLSFRAIRVETQAKLNASHPPPSQPGTGPAVRTGRLRSSITWQLGHDELGLYADIGSAVVYARRVEIDFNRPYLRPALPAGAG